MPGRIQPACQELKATAQREEHDTDPLSDEPATDQAPAYSPQLVEECFQQVLDTVEAIGDPFEQAFFAMVHLAYLQAFEDVNKRVSRLAANIPLIRGNLCPVSFVDVPERAYIDGILGVYELNRIDRFLF